MRTTIKIDERTFVVDLCLKVSNNIYASPEPEWYYADTAHDAPTPTEFLHSTQESKLSKAILAILDDKKNIIQREQWAKEKAEREAPLVKKKSTKPK